MATRVVNKAWLDGLEKLLLNHVTAGTPGPLAGASLAERIGIRWEPGPTPLRPRFDHETARRRVRELIDALRHKGYRVCANGDGYWLARDDREWSEYLESRRKNARYEFVAVRQMREAAGEKRSGQMALGELGDHGLAPADQGENGTAWAKA